MLGREEPAQDVETGRFLADEQYSQARNGQDPGDSIAYCSWSRAR